MVTSGHTCGSQIGKEEDILAGGRENTIRLTRCFLITIAIQANCSSFVILKSEVIRISIQEFFSTKACKKHPYMVVPLVSEIAA